MSDALRILHINDQRSFGGGENQTRLLVEELERLGVENHVLLRSGGGLRARLEGKLPAGRLHDLPPGPPALMLPFAAASLARRHDIQLAHAHSGRSTIGLTRLPEGVLRVAHRRIPEPLSTRSLRRARGCDAVISISGAIRSVLERQRLGGGEGPCIRTIYSSVEELHPTTLRFALEGSPAFAYLGHFRRHKGLDVLLDGLALIDGEFPGLKIHLLGEGEEEAALREQARRLGLGQRVSFIPFQSNPADWLAAIDLLLLPSRDEGLGSVALQAQSLGKAVLGCRAGGIPECVRHGETGWLVPPEDPQALAEGIRLLAGNEKLRRKLGAAGPAWIASRFSSGAMAAATLELYHELVDGRPGPGAFA